MSLHHRIIQMMSYLINLIVIYLLRERETYISIKINKQNNKNKELKSSDSIREIAKDHCDFNYEKPILLLLLEFAN
jgi:hypothetical protein